MKRRRARLHQGTTVYISDLNPDVLRALRHLKMAEYLRRRREASLARGEYRIEVIEGRRQVDGDPEEADGIRLEIAARTTPGAGSSSPCTWLPGPTAVGEWRWSMPLGTTTIKRPVGTSKQSTGGGRSFVTESCS